MSGHDNTVFSSRIETLPNGKVNVILSYDRNTLPTNFLYLENELQKAANIQQNALVYVDLSADI
jgi:hypothetical protein